MTNKMILNRIHSYIYPILHSNQNGFRSGISTSSHILTLRRLFEGVKIIIFVDFKTAFDCINRVTMLQIIEAYGIPKIIMQTINLTYKDTLVLFMFVITLYYAM